MTLRRTACLAGNNISIYHWFLHSLRRVSKSASADSPHVGGLLWSTCCRQCGSVSSVAMVEEFWLLYVHLRRPMDERPSACDYHVFREGIRPMWEDDANMNGGKWIVRLRKGVAARYWEDLVRALTC
eukprot:6179145-Pleurochrysis_carterae.AAC.3